MPERMKLGRTPDTICLLAAVASAGLVLTISGILPGSVAGLVPTPVGLLWSAVYTLSAGLSLIGVLWRDDLTGWGLELTGRIPLAVTSLTYFAVLAGTMDSWGASIVLSMAGALGVSSAIRVVWLLRRLGRFKAVVVAGRDAREGRQE